MESQNPLYDLYEKLYFHEIEMREKLNGRLQTPLAIIVSTVGVLAFMLQNFDKNFLNYISWIFIFFLSLSSIFLAVSIYYFVCSWYGHTYSFLPSAQDTESYLKELDKTYDGYEEKEALSKKYLDDYLCRYLIDCSSINTQCNDKRSIFLHKTNGFLIIVALLSLLSFLCFYVGDLDKGRHAKPLQVSINPIEMQGSLTNGKKSNILLKVTTMPSLASAKKDFKAALPLSEKKDGK